MKPRRGVQVENVPAEKDSDMSAPNKKQRRRHWSADIPCHLAGNSLACSDLLPCHQREDVVAPHSGQVVGLARQPKKNSVKETGIAIVGTQAQAHGDIRRQPLIRLSVSVALFGLSCVFGAAYYALHFKWRDCFNALGRCFDPDTGHVYLEQSGAAWFSMAAIALIGSVYQFWKFRRQRSHN